MLPGANTCLKRVGKFLNIKQGEGKPTLLLLLHSFFTGTVLVMFETIAFALFLANYEPGVLAYCYMITGIIGVLIGIGYSHLESTVSVGRRLFLTILVLAIISLVFWFGMVVSRAAWIFFVMILAVPVFQSLCDLVFWQVASFIFNIRQGKRLFGLIDSGQLVAGSLAGFATPLLTGIFGVVNLLLVVAFGLIAMLILFGFIFQLYGDRFDFVHDEEEISSPVKELVKSRYAVRIFILGMLCAFGYFFLEYAFYVQAEAKFQNEESLARFLGIFFGIGGLLMLTFKVFISGRVISRYGIGLGLSVQPLVLVGGIIAVVVAGNFSGSESMFIWGIFAVYMILDVTESTLTDPSFEVLYQPLKGSKSVFLQSAVKNIANPLALGITGVVVWALNYLDFLDATSFSFLYLPVVVIWAGVALVTASGYKEEVVKAIGLPETPSVDLSHYDQRPADFLRKKLFSTDPAEVMCALRFAHLMDPLVVTEAARDLLAHENQGVREEVVRFIEEQQLHSAFELLQRRLQLEESPTVKAALLRALCAISSEGTPSEATDSLTAEHEDIRMAAIIGLLRYGDIEDVLLAGECLRGIHGIKNLRSKVFTARVLGKVTMDTFYRPLISLLMDARERYLVRPLLQLLADPDIRIRREALKAASEVRDTSLLPPMLAQALDSATGSSVINAITGFGEEAVAVLASLFEQEQQNNQTRSIIALICGRIRGQTVLGFLGRHLDADDRGVFTEIVEALSASRYRAREQTRQVVGRRFCDEIRNAVFFTASPALLNNDDQDGPLRESMASELRLSKRRTLLLLSLLYDATALRRAQEQLEWGEKEKTAMAIEAVDVLIGDEYKRLLLPLLEDNLPVEQVKILLSRNALEIPDRRHCLQVILAGHPIETDAWSKACALNLISKTGLVDMTPHIEELLETSDSLLRETAWWALANLSPELYRLRAANARTNSESGLAPCLDSIDRKLEGDRTMFLIIEKVFILKSILIFADTPENSLAALATQLEEIEIPQGTTFIKKGEIGQCMDIIVKGRVRIHDGERIITHLGEREIVGELAVLDPQPRSADVTAVEDTILFRIDRDVLYEMMSQHYDITFGILRMLCRRLRTASEIERATQATSSNF